MATVKRGNYGLVETATARCELSGPRTVQGLFQRTGPLGGPLVLGKVREPWGKGERPMGCSGSSKQVWGEPGEVTSEGEQDGCYRAGGGRKVEPEKPRTLNLGKSWGRVYLWVAGSGGRCR